MAPKSIVDDIHAASKIEEVDLSKLQVDYEYQRDPSEKLVDQIADNWDVVASELILVSNRGVRPVGGEVRGGLFIVNGQHRSKAAQKKGLGKIWARVIDLRKVEDPGAIEAGFRLKTNVKLSDRPLERFKAQLRAGNEESLAIKKILEGFNTEINTQPNNDVGINCVSTIEGIYRLDDGALLKDTLEIVQESWKEVSGKRSGANLLKGLCWFIEKHSEESDRTRFVAKLQGIGLAALESRARTTSLSMGGTLWMNYYRSMVELYNEQLSQKRRLSWMLRGAQSLNKSGSKGK
jgi:hypothetical protein